MEVWLTWSLWSQPSVESCDKKPLERWLVLVKYCGLHNWIPAKRLGTVKKFVPVWEKLREDSWDGRHQELRGRNPQRPIWATMNGDCLASRLYQQDWQSTIRCSTAQHLADGSSRQKSEEKQRSCDSFADCIHSLAKLAIGNINVCRLLQCCELTDSLIVIHITEKNCKETWLFCPFVVIDLNFISCNNYRQLRRKFTSNTTLH